MPDNKNHPLATLTDRDILLRIFDELKILNGRCGSLERSRSWFKGWVAAFSFLCAVLAAVWAARGIGLF